MVTGIVDLGPLYGGMLFFTELGGGRGEERDNPVGKSVHKGQDENWRSQASMQAWQKVWLHARACASLQGSRGTGALWQMGQLPWGNG